MAAQLVGVWARAAWVVVLGLAEGYDGGEVAGENGAEEREGEERDEAGRVLFGAGLGFEEVH
jgi:hypothetical protein